VQGEYTSDAKAAAIQAVLPAPMLRQPATVRRAYTHHRVLPDPVDHPVVGDIAELEAVVTEVHGRHADAEIYA
jgi:hypothetical protein